MLLVLGYCMYVFENFHSRSNCACRFIWTAIIIPYDIPSLRTSSESAAQMKAIDESCGSS